MYILTLMTEILNKYFFPAENFNNEYAISLLEDFLYTKKCIFLKDINTKKEQQQQQQQTNKEEKLDVIEKLVLKESPIIKKDCKIIIKEEKVNNRNKDRICPNKMDTLFWCVFIAVYGYDEYNTITNHYLNREMEERQKIIDHLKKNPSKIKNANVKITKVAFQEMLSDLMISKKITLPLVIMLCLYYNIVIFVVFDNIYIEFSVNNEILDKQKFIIYKNHKREYEIDLDSSNDKVNNICNNFLKIENHLKPLKAISNYTINELKEILHKINIKDDTVKELKSKTSIYNYINDYCVKKIL